jgi:hypothetical protein
VVRFHHMPKPGHAEYMRGYRKTVKSISEREAREEGFRAGIAACVEVVRKRGEHQLAHRLEMISHHESYELQQRRAFVKTMEPGNGSTRST